MDPLLVVIIALALALFATAVYMEWLGLLSVVSNRSRTRHPGCGHPKLTPANDDDLCWHCRHRHMDAALHTLRH
ncbi:MAG TPA: hypothetical protein VHB69_15210 [Mycobacteriales bacterium]|nr:hypothetical protein [Mycobacteriales bacterium]